MRSLSNASPAPAAQSPQRRVVSCAAELFADQGYAATSVRQIAQRAKVSLDTVYARGGKADIFLQAMEAVLSGSSDGTPLLEHPDMDAVWNAPTLREVIVGLVAATVAADARGTRIWPAFVEGAGSEPTLRAAMTKQNDAMRGEGRKAVTFLVDRGLCHADIDVDRTADLIWSEAHPLRYSLLVGLAGWSVDEFSEQLTERILELLTRPVSRGGGTQCPE